jgi:hypothetical protein
MIAVGIDPGKSGGLVMIHSNNNECSMHKCPENASGMSDILLSAKDSAYSDNIPIMISIEKVHAFPTDARSAAFKFGMNYGMWLGVIGALNIPFIEVAPKVWMKSYAPLPKIKQERKKKIKEIATDIYSDVYSNTNKITYAVSDAALIAIWCLERSQDDK